MEKRLENGIKKRPGVYRDVLNIVKEASFIVEGQVCRRCCSCFDAAVVAHY
jgi:hypothetical protein